MAATDSSKRRFRAFRWISDPARAIYGDGICNTLERTQDIVRGTTLLLEMYEDSEAEDDCSDDPRPIFTNHQRGSVMRYLIASNQLLDARLERLIWDLNHDAQDTEDYKKSIADINLTKAAARAADARSPDLEARR